MRVLRGSHRVRVGSQRILMLPMITNDQRMCPRLTSVKETVGPGVAARVLQTLMTAAEGVSAEQSPSAHSHSLPKKRVRDSLGMTAARKAPARWEQRG